MKLLSAIGLSLLTLVIVLSGAWAVLALAYQVPLHEPWRAIVCGAFALFSLAHAVMLWRTHAVRQSITYVVAYAFALVMILGWWTRIEPSDNRVWSDDVAQHLQWKKDGDMVTLTNVRNFDWRSDTDYTPRWETRHYDLRQLKSADMIVSYWMGPIIAHTLVSFGFDDEKGSRRQLVFSIEIRKERGEEFSALAGFFKRFELSLIAADERDIVRVRTNVRGEDDYLYRVNMKPEAMRELLLAYLDEANSLKAQPQFYNTLTANCTTIVYEMASKIVGGLPLDWRLLASGYLPEYLRDVGGLTPGHELEELRTKGHITSRAKVADLDPNFSAAIRQGIPPLTPLN